MLSKCELTFSHAIPVTRSQAFIDLTRVKVLHEACTDASTYTEASNCMQALPYHKAAKYVRM